jgi:small subunit ribosomal protein S1
VSGTDEDFAALLAEFERAQKREEAPRQRKLRVGDTVKGRVVSVGREAVFVELGAKAEAVLELSQVTDAAGAVTVRPGDEVEGRVVDLNGPGGCVVLARTAASRTADVRADLERAQQAGVPVEGLVTGVNKGGVEVQVFGVRGFCPISQLELRFVEDPQSYVGQRLQFRISRVEATGRSLNVVLSRRALLEEERDKQAAVTRQKLAEGAVLPGTVTTLKPYGAFVDLGGIEGMIHISELGFGRVEHPSEVLAVGQRVNAQVLRIQPGTGGQPDKISLSLKAMEQDPFADIASRFPAGSVVRGVVTRLSPFGAFVELSPGVEGLVHLSELSSGRRINHPREAVKLGQEVEVSVLSVDTERRRLSLSLKASAAAAQEASADEIAAHGTGGGSGFGTLGDLLKKRRDR